MKKTLLTTLLFLCFYSINLRGQNYFPPSGSIGVGTNTPIGLIHMKNLSGIDYMQITKGSSSFDLDIYSNYNGSDDIQTGSFGYGVMPHAQAWQIWERHVGIAWNPLLTVKTNGNVGVGNETPRVKLDIIGKTIVQNALLTNDYTNIGQHNGQIRILNGLGNLGSRALEIALMDDGKGVIQVNEAGVGYNNLLLNPASGNVAIGMVSPPAGYKLAVAGSVIAESVVVKLQSAWPDCVFKPQYGLRSLAEVRSYITKNQHLPDMPTEQEVARDGINVGEVNIKLLKKVEELTLYLLEKDQQIVDQQTKTDKQEVRIALLEKMLLHDGEKKKL